LWKIVVDSQIMLIAAAIVKVSHRRNDRRLNVEHGLIALDAISTLSSCGQSTKSA